MYLSVYHFDGDSTDLLARYDRMVANFPDEALLLHACVATADGISVYDSCPDIEAHAEFITSDAWLNALSDAGLPTPRIVGLGDVHHWVAPRVATT